MNDFTKEELEELLMWSNHLAGCNPLLVKKIQSMIDRCSFGKYNVSMDGKKLILTRLNDE